MPPKVEDSRDVLYLDGIIWKKSVHFNLLCDNMSLAGIYADMNMPLHGGFNETYSGT